MRSSKKLYVILNSDETLFLQNDKPRIYRELPNFIDKERYKNCKVAVFELTDIQKMLDLKLEKESHGQVQKGG